MLTWPARSAPSIGCWPRTRSASSSGDASDAPEKTPAFIEPRLRRCRTNARVSMPAMPTMLLADQFVFQCSGGPPVRDPRRGIAHRVAGHPDLVAAAFAVLTVPPGVADLRGGGHHDLAVIARVGQRLLVPGHAGGKDCLAQGLADRAERRPGEGPAVLEDQHRLHSATPSGQLCSHPSYSSRLSARNPVSILTPDGSRHRIARIPSRAATFPAMPCSVRMPEIDSLRNPDRLRADCAAPGCPRGGESAPPCCGSPGRRR